MSRDRAAELAAELHARGLETVLSALGNPAMMLREGIDLTGWECLPGNGCAAFRHADYPAERLVIWVNAPERERRRWQALMADKDDAILVLSGHDKGIIPLPEPAAHRPNAADGIPF